MEVALFIRVQISIHWIMSTNIKIMNVLNIPFESDSVNSIILTQ